MRSRAVLLLVVAACHREPHRGDPADATIATPAVAPRADAAIADAGIDAAPPCPPDATTHAFRFGTLSVPAGWCWRRTSEGDDLSGVVLDDAGRTRLTFDQLAFDERVGDACAKASGSHDAHAYRTCELADGRHCASFHGAANVCGEAAVLADVLRTLAPKR